jgi:3-hydroxyisobutyrate dehydrogenase-like beta-hydroxyacid dehydrogenase
VNGLSKERTVALLHPGEMGAAVGACLVDRGYQVVWASAGRGASTKQRAGSAGLRDLGSLAQCVDAAGTVLSVCPPHAAMAVAKEVAARGFHGVYVDANAIASETAINVGRIVEAGGALFVDGGIIGPPPRPSVASRLYLSGSGAREVAQMFAGSSLEAITLDSAVGAASALKACYAGWTKGATALLASIRAVAMQEGVEGALLAEWRRSQPGLVERSEKILGDSRKAWRWIAEMEEIAANFAAVGLPAGFHSAAADVYRRLESKKDATTPPSYAEVVAAISRPS